MAGKKKNTEVVSLQKYKRKGHLNIGTILFGIIFVYLVFTVLIYFTKDRVSVYEVREEQLRRRKRQVRRNQERQLRMSKRYVVVLTMALPLMK